MLLSPVSELPGRAVLHEPYYGVGLLGGAAHFRPKQRVLSAREMVCSCYGILGFSERQTAHELDISPETVASHLAHTRRKLNTNRGSGLFHAALSAGIMTVERRIDPLDLPECSELLIESGQLAALGMVAAEIGDTSRKPTSAPTVRNRLRMLGELVLPEDYGFSHFAIGGATMILAGLVDYPYPPTALMPRPCA